MLNQIRPGAAYSVFYLALEKIQFADFQTCVRLSNGELEIVAATDFGQRFLAYNFGGENVLGIHADTKIETALGEFNFYGGHRLWIAPNTAPVEFEFDEQTNSIRLVQSIDTITQTQKEITVTLDKRGSGIQIHHKMTNLGAAKIEIAA